MKLWLDFDPAGLVYSGLDVDDDLAFLAALALHSDPTHPLEIIGISVCGGNAPLADTWKNARRLLAFVGWAGASSIGSAGSTDSAGGSAARDAPAASASLESPPVVAGASWRDMHVAWPWLRRLHALRLDVIGDVDAAAAAIARAVLAHPPGTVTILSLGPPTNVARALQWGGGGGNDNGNGGDAVALRLKRVVLMGGSLDGGPLDLNWMSDRAAARAVIDAPVPTLMVPLQTCAQVFVTDALVERFADTYCTHPPLLPSSSSSSRASQAPARANSSTSEPAARGVLPPVEPPVPGEPLPPLPAACALVPKLRLQARYAMPWLVNHHVARRFETRGQRHPPSRALLLLLLLPRRRRRGRRRFDEAPDDVGAPASAFAPTPASGDDENDSSSAAITCGSDCALPPPPPPSRGFVPWDVVALLALTHAEDLFEDWTEAGAILTSCEEEEVVGPGAVEEDPHFPSPPSSPRRPWAARRVFGRVVESAGGGEPCDGAMVMDWQRGRGSIGDIAAELRYASAPSLGGGGGSSSGGAAGEANWAASTEGRLGRPRCVDEDDRDDDRDRHRGLVLFPGKVRNEGAVLEALLTFALVATPAAPNVAAPALVLGHLVPAALGCAVLALALLALALEMLRRRFLRLSSGLR